MLNLVLNILPIRISGNFENVYAICETACALSARLQKVETQMC